MEKKLKAGDIIFFKKGKFSTKSKVEMTFPGYAFSVYIGHVPQFGKDPTQRDLAVGLGAIGYLRFDDVAEFLGDEMAAKCIEMFEAKCLQSALPPTESSLIKSVSGAPIELPQTTQEQQIMNDSDIT